MVFFSLLFATILGLPLGVILSITSERGIRPQKRLNQILGSIINIARSFPFIILIILLLPLSRIVIGTSIGSTAAIIPLAISATPFVARLFVGALNEIDRGLIEASQSMGAKDIEIIKMMLIEALPSLLNALTITVISLVGYSAMAGAVGSGGLGDVAIRLGYHTAQDDVLLYSVIAIIIMVQIFQTIGNTLISRIRRRRG